MIHPDSNHPSKILNKPVQVSILTDEGIEHETVNFFYILWNTVDMVKDTVMISSTSGEPKVAVYSTMELPREHQPGFELDPSEYGQSLSALMKLAKGDTGGSTVAAQVLLSAYNGSYFHLSVPALCRLDDDNYRHAMTVIHGRKATFREPQGFIENGDDQFSDLWDQWKNALHVEERFKSMCSRCYGTGKKADEDGEPTSEGCWYCDGHGTLLPEGLEYSKG